MMHAEDGHSLQPPVGSSTLCPFTCVTHFSRCNCLCADASGIAKLMLNKHFKYVYCKLLFHARHAACQVEQHDKLKTQIIDLPEA